MIDGATVPAWLLLILLAGAVARVTRLITADYITRPFRTWLTKRLGREHRLTYFVTCDFCVSFWVAVILTPITVFWGDNRVVLCILAALTVSETAGLLSRLERE